MKNLEGNFVKKAHKKVKYTAQEIQHLQKCMDPVDGPLYFAENFVKIQHPVKGEMQLKLFDYQRRLIRGYHENRFSIAMLPRQTGKTTVASAFLLWQAMFVPDSNILIAAHKYMGAQDIMSRFRYAYESLPDFIRAGVYSYNKGSVEFDNGSKVKATTTTENTGRGMSLSLIYCDEFAFVQPPEKAREFWTALSPTLATGGRAIITSTPNSDEDQFAILWKEANKRTDDFGNQTKTGVNGFFPISASWNEHPDRDEKWKKEEISRIGEERFRREHECEFLIFDETLISPTKLIDMEGKDPIHKTGQVRWYKKIDPERIYSVTLDPAVGTGSDYSAIQVFELPSMEQVGEWRHNTTPITQQMKIMRDICNYIKEEADAIKPDRVQIYYTFENNAVGEACVVALQDIGVESVPGMAMSEPVRKGHRRKFRQGFNTTHKSKVSACSRFKELVESNKMTIHSKPLISELKSFVGTGVTFNAKPGEHDDLVSSCLLGVRLMQTLAKFDPRIFERLRETDAEFQAPMPIFIG